MGVMRYRFKFWPVSEGSRSAGFLADVFVEMWFDDKCLVKSEGWSVRNGREGLWLRPPQETITGGTGEKKYRQFVQFWPRVKGSETEPLRNRFQKAFEKAYHEWQAARVDGTGPQVAGSEAHPSDDRETPMAAPPPKEPPPPVASEPPSTLESAYNDFWNPPEPERG